ncbi:hypothetical protein [Catenuloplanes atrovinosus]|uniref:Uncharacterized protein n=1 Tax=Catenuloplanes atrovinosus TaxID=137266 RepID=A0AAE3YMA5_9ACTN|nr:hypothetical protein [Catenuloplanes atrovinosus]MDR7276398.1 hypothetical protein [Catenuloplanes atrovinosus]
MSRRVGHAVGAAASVLVGVGIGIVANVVTASWSWTWALALGALVSSLVALETVRSLRGGGDPESGPVGVAGRYAVLGTASVSLIAIVALVWLVPRGGGRAGTSCQYEPYPTIPELAYRCVMDRWRPDSTIPVFDAARPGAEAGELRQHTGARQYFECQLPGEPIALDGTVRTGHWALTLADDPPHWGVVPQVYFEDGGSGERDRALPDCGTAQLDKIGKPYRR